MSYYAQTAQNPLGYGRKNAGSYSTGSTEPRRHSYTLISSPSDPLVAILRSILREREASLVHSSCSCTAPEAKLMVVRLPRSVTNPICRSPSAALVVSRTSPRLFVKFRQSQEIAS